MNFVAIDFETANEKRNSPCSIGITVVEEGEIKEEKYFLIRPPELRFSNMNIMIHGIREEDVVNEKEFNELWEEIKEYIDGKVVVAHNAPFDISVLRRTLEHYNLQFPNIKFLCTMAISRKYYPFLENAKLNTVNKFLGFEFSHHNAGEDARACANILMNIRSEENINSLDELLDILGVGYGELGEDGYKPSSSLKGEYKTSKRICGEKINKGTFGDTLSGEVVVFTAPLTSMSRGEAMTFVRKLGGETGGTVTKKTTLLVVGGKRTKRFDGASSTSKLRRAMSLKDSGSDISIIGEEEFLDKIGK